MIRHFCDWCGSDVGGATPLHKVKWTLTQNEVSVSSNEFSVCRECLLAAGIHTDGRFRIEKTVIDWLDRLIKVWKHKAASASETKGK